MKHIDFYLDFVSPYAYLAFEQLPQALEGLSYSVAYRPIVLGALLKHHGQLGPAEIPAKRSWTYRHVLWLGHAHGIPIQMPATHPFNSLQLLRLAHATAPNGQTNRVNTEKILRHVWRGGEEASETGRMQELAQGLTLLDAADSDAVKARLRAATDAAIAAGVFGVPSYRVDGRVFWGFDGLAMLRAYLSGEPWFEGDAWQSADQRPALTRARS